MLTGWISDADTAERVVRDGLADFAIMGRALIADSRHRAQGRDLPWRGL